MLKHTIRTNKTVQAVSSLVYRILFNTFLWGGGQKCIRGRRNQILYNNSFVSKLRIRIRGNDNIVYLGNCSRLSRCKIVICGDNNSIVIGDYVSLNRTRFWLDQDHNSCKIGSGTTVRGNTHLGVIEGTSINIGGDCMFSEDIDIRTGDSHSITNMHGERTNISKDVNISEHVWVARNVTVLKGVTIPRNCVIGAGSLVTKGDYVSNSILCGNPCRIIRENINWDRKRIVVPGPKEQK